LSKSNNNFPLNIVGLSSEGTVIAHVRLSVVNDEDAKGILLESGSYYRVLAIQTFAHDLFVMTVVVSKALRGKGIGRAIMAEAEKYSASFVPFISVTEQQPLKMHLTLMFCLVRRGYDTLFLSTHDQQGFYSRLGFVECEPVTSLGDNASRISQSQLSNLLRAFGGKSAGQTKDKTWMKKPISSSGKPDSHN
jgi:GNAT superfamily N-acetyltransferase